ncbi:hypothetical protein [Lunatimonas salinarum]|uniref:hypothetical protein n=1 Tax=Lunatimonas salinarum TaxID=1774590 RepID=UPI001ADFE3B1|nr:hypothetical protein [Lunatimonas salinarum]
MKKFILLSLTILVIFQFGCVSEDEQPIQEIENTAFFRPSGKLAFTYSHRNAHEYLSVAEHLYDSEGAKAKTILNNELLGRTIATYYVYNELDSLHWERRYNITGDQRVFNLAYERVFDPQNRPIELRAHLADDTERWVYRNHFDDNNRLVNREMPNGEREVYTYLDNGRIATIRIQYNNSDLSIGHLYRYDDKNRLIAKEYFVIRGDSIPESGEGNIEEFDYDEQNRLVESRYYDPNFGFVLQGRITYEYY